MGLILYTEIKSTPGVQQVVERLNIPLTTDEGIPRLISPQWERDDQLFDDATRFLFYMPYESTRAIEVWLEQGNFCVCIMPFSTDVELDLALRFLEVCRYFGATRVASAGEHPTANSSGNGPLAIEQLRTRYTPDLNMASSIKALEELCATVDGREDSIALSGPIREFMFGAHLSSVLQKIPEPATRVRRLLEMMKCVQYWTVRPDFDGFAEPDISASIMGKQIATIRPDSPYVVPHQIEELIFDTGEKLHKVPVRDFLQKWTQGLPLEKFQLLDERQFKLFLPSSDFKQLLDTHVSDLDTPVTDLESVSQVVDHLTRRARREAMTGEQFGKAVTKAEKLYDFDPKIYKIFVAAFAAFGYGYVLFFLGLALWGASTFGPSVQRPSGIDMIALVLFAISTSLGLLLLRALLLVRFPSPTGIKITEADAPGFFKMLDTIQSKLGVEIDEVMIDHQINAFITQVPRLGILGWHKNYLVVGLPLLYASTVERATSVLSHEMGHISGNHGKFGSWIYGLAESWQRLLVAMGKRSKIGFIAFFPFYSWYLPRFKAYTKVLNRQHEHEADRMATLVTNRMANAESLIAVHMQGRYLQKKFWTDISKRAFVEPTPPQDVILEFARYLQNPDISEREGQEFYTQLLLNEGDPDDTHPPLAERLLAIGYPARDRTRLLETPLEIAPLLTIKDSAANAFLGARAETLAKTLSKFWHDGVKLSWKIEHTAAQEMKKRLDELDTKARNKELPDDDWLEFAALMHKFQGTRMAVEIYRKFIEKHPRHPKGSFLLGRALLEENNETGIAYLEEAMNKDARYIADGCLLSIDYYERHRKDDTIKEYRKRLAEHKASAVLAYEERERISKSEEFAAHDLKPAVIQEIQTRLKNCQRIQAGYLVKRRLKHLPGISHYLLGVERRFSYSSNQLETLAFLSALQDSLGALEESITVVDLTEFQRHLRPNFATVANSQIFTGS